MRIGIASPCRTTTAIPASGQWRADTTIPHAAAAHRLRGSVSADWFDEDGFLADSACWTPGLAEDIARLDAQQREHAVGEITYSSQPVIRVRVVKLAAVTRVGNLEHDELRPASAPIYGRAFGRRVLQRDQQQLAVGEFEGNVGAVPLLQDLGDVAQFVLCEVGCRGSHVFNLGSTIGGQRRAVTSALCTKIMGPVPRPGKANRNIPTGHTPLEL